MSLVDFLDVSVGLDNSVFNMKLKEVAKGLREAFDIDQKAANSVAALEIKLRKQAETFGMTARQAEIYKLQAQGIPPAVLANVKALDKHITKLEEQAKKQARMKQAFGEMVSGFKMGIGIIERLSAAAIGAAAAFGALVVHTLKVIDDQGDMAARLGLTIGQLQRFHYAVELTGSKAEDFDNALQKMTVIIGKAVVEGGPAAEAFQKLGVNLQQLAGMTPDRQFLVLVDAISKIKDPSKQAALAVETMGKSSVFLLNTIRAGTPEINKFMNEATAMGVGFSNAQAQMAGDANDAMMKIWLVFQATIGKIAIDLAPLIIDLSNKFIAWAKDAKASGEFVDTVVGGLIGLVGVLGNAINVVHAGWKAFTLDFKGAAELLANPPGDKFEKWAQKLVEGGRNALAQMKDFKPAMADVSEVMDVAADKAKKLAEKIKKITEDSQSPLEKYMRKLGELKELMASGLDPKIALAEDTKNFKEFFDTTQVAKDLDDLKGRLKGMIEGAETPMQKLKDDFADIRKGLETGLLDETQAEILAQKANNDFFGTTTRFTGAIDARSQEARSMSLQAQYGFPQQKEDINKTMNVSVAVQREMLGVLRTIASGGQVKYQEKDVVYNF